MTALAATDIRVAFGGVVACDGVSLSVAAGEAVGLTGPNGSGKSTLLNAITGLVPATGTLRIGSRRLDLGRPRPVRAAGVARVFQAPQNYFALTALENVALGCADHRLTGLPGALLRRRSMAATERSRWRAAAEALGTVGLADSAATMASALTYGQQRLLELARAIVARPDVLMLDEPSAGLNGAETRHLAGLLGGLRDAGMALIVVDHKIDFLDSLCERIVVMQMGRVIAEGSPATIWREQSVIDAYLGAPQPDDREAGEREHDGAS